jgi:cobyric acid synthase
MSAPVVVITSYQPRAGKTHFAAGLAGWLARSGLRVAPLHLSSRDGDCAPGPGGEAVCRAAAVLAEACGLRPEPEFDSCWDTLERLCAEYDVVVVESPEAPGSMPFLNLCRTAAGISVDGLGSLPLFTPDLMPAAEPELAALPAWRLGQGPRVGVVSLPHITNFPDFRLFVGSEWLAQPAAGRFDLLFFPATSNPDSDAEWLRETGLDVWLAAQRDAGARLLGCGWCPLGATALEPGAPADYRAASRLLGRRLSAPLPDEATLERLADWVGALPGLAAWVRDTL